MFHKERIQSYLELIKKTGNLSSIPEDELSVEDRELLEQLFAEGLLDESIEMVEDLDVDQDWSEFQSRISKEKKILILPRIIRYAAIFVGILGISICLKFMFTSPDNSLLLTEDTITLNTGNDIRAIIANKKQKIALASGEVVAVQEDNVLKYIGGPTTEDLVYNELQIPYGKTFTLQLADGTQVELNSGTKIKFPAMFPKNGRREIFMEGEAFFKVSKDRSRPFIVNSRDVAVEVLGTEFNVSAYSEQNEISTVLVEGSVSLSHASKPLDTVLLKPGNKGTWSQISSKMEVSDVDTTLYTSWLNGEIVLRDAPFKELLLKLERAYNVSIINNNQGLNELTFNARYNRNVEQIEEVLEAVKVIVPFEFEMIQDSNGTRKRIIIN